MDHSMHEGMQGAMQEGMHHMIAATGFDYTLAFIAGFLGSGHCLGMCGALVSGYFINSGGKKSYLPYFAYQLTRIAVYVSIGLLAASLGVVMVSSGILGKFQSILQMTIGSIVIILALGILGLIPWQGSIKMLPMGMLRTGYAKARTKGPVVGAMIAGFMNGLMPCPLTFAMYVEATSATSIVDGGMLLLAFGAGTLPTMLLISVVFNKMGSSLRGLMLKSAAVIMIFMGLNTIYKGLSFYEEEGFKHRTFLHLLKEKMDEVILLGYQVMDYISTMISHLQGLQ
ncbi:MAG: sulfite exporter TauE/SafE family protein [Methylococcales bacterium]|nr:sulfite exporter TauE/SafE family protein [Methylococcales bacterium]